MTLQEIKAVAVKNGGEGCQPSLHWQPVGLSGFDGYCERVIGNIRVGSAEGG